MSREMLSGIPSHLGLDGAVRGAGRRLGWGHLLPRPGNVRDGREPAGAGERPTYHDGWGPRQASPIRQDGMPGPCYKYLAADRPRNVNGGVGQAGENVQFRQDGLFVCFKNMFFPP